MPKVNPEENRPLSPIEKERLDSFSKSNPETIAIWETLTDFYDDESQRQRTLYRWSCCHGTPEWIKALQKLSRIPQD